MTYLGDFRADMQRRGFMPLNPPREELEAMNLEQLLEFNEVLNASARDMETLIDFCNEAAGSGAKEVIRDAHDIMHVLLGGDKTREWAWVADWLLLPTNPRWTTDAWPGVKVRMLDVFARAGGSLKREE